MSAVTTERRDQGCRLARALCAAAIAVAVPSCGSTVAGQPAVTALGATRSAPTTEPGLQSPGPTSPELTSPLAGGVPTPLPTTSGVGSLTDAARVGSDPGGGTGSAPADLGPVSGRGFDANSILLGYTTSRDADAVLNGLGFGGLSVGNTDEQVQAIVHDINANGGILGRKVEVYAHDYSTANYANNPDVESQKACSDFTEDHHVFAVLNTIGLGNRIVTQCLAKFDVPYMDDRASLGRDPVYTKYARSLFQPSSMNINTYVPLFLQGLLTQRYFIGWNTATGDPGSAPVKVGIMHFDDPVWNYYIGLVKQALSAAGYPVKDEITYTHNLDDVFATSANAVVKFRQDGITHVFNANIAFFEAAEDQHYRPRYAFAEDIGANALSEIAPANQLHGSLGVGYNPFADVAAGGADEEMRKPIVRKCRQVMRRGGQDTSEQATFQLMLADCDLFNFLRRTLNIAGGISTEAVTTGADALGGSYASTLTFKVKFDARHHAGAVGARDFAYVDACTCYHYTSPVFHR